MALRGEPHRRVVAAASLALLIASVGACSSDSNGTTGSTSASSTGSGGNAGANGGAVATAGGTTGTGGAMSTGGAASGGTAGTATSGTTSGGAGGGNTTSAGGTGGMGGMGAGGIGAGGQGAATGDGGATSGGAGGTGGAGGSGGTGGTGGAGSYNPCPTTPGEACVVLPLGDSITEGCCTQPYGGYRIELFRQAVTNGKNLTFVGSLSNGPAMVEGRNFPQQHEGHGGYTIDTDAGHSGISGMITNDALSNYNPHIVLLMIGTNDINGNVDINNAPDRLDSLLGDITSRAPSALLVVSAIIPTQNAGTNQRVEAYNAAIPDLVEARAMAGEHVVFLDSYATYSANPSYGPDWMADNLHPNDDGYVVLGQSFYDVIDEFLPAAP